MMIFADTADIAEIRDLAKSGLIDGITTNPSLVARTGRPFADVVTEICDAVAGPVAAQAACRHGQCQTLGCRAELAAEELQAPREVLSPTLEAETCRIPDVGNLALGEEGVRGRQSRPGKPRHAEDDQVPDRTPREHAF